ncbi:MAG TPA: M14 family zinc carboxypeptidase [Planctomycetota bacterium]|jgi:hypothetical protein
MRTLPVLILVAALFMSGCDHDRSTGPDADKRPAPIPKPTFGPPPPLESAGRAVSPTSAEVEQRVRQLQKEHPSKARVEAPQKTHDGLPIYAVTLTDPAAPEADKQHVLIVAGQHGNEESGRMVALGLMDWLLSPDGAETLRKQKIVVMPNVSPDAAERDQYDTAEGIRPNLDHGPQGPWSAEGKALEAMSFGLQPEVFVDMHARGGAGVSCDLVLYPMTLPYLEDDNLLHQIAADMVRAGEAAGIPHHTHSLAWPGWSNNGINEISSTVFHYRNFHSLVFLTETSEHNVYATPAEKRTAVGVARLKALLEYGNRRHWWSQSSGYPCNLLGMSDSAFVAVGKTAAERRQSRITLWKNRESLERPKSVGPEKAKEKFYKFTAKEALPSPAGVHVRCVGKMEIESAVLDGKPLPPSETTGYSTWQDSCSTFVVVAMQSLASGAHNLEIRFK